MTLHLRVAASLDPLVDELVAVLARPLPDPFVPEVVAVPGDGVRAWLEHRLARRLGRDGRGVVANIEFVYPAQVVDRALQRADDTSPWSVGRLTFAIHALLAEHGPALGQSGDLARARSIADLFDRYTLHRPAMVVAWGAGRDVDAAGQMLAPAHRWQPHLWRLVCAHLGGPSDADAHAAAAVDLAVGRTEPDLPDRVSLFGLASLPGPHLRVVAALSRQRDVHVLAPVPSMAMWQQLRSLPADPLHLPLDRRDDPSAHLGRHGLLASWGRPAREAHLLLLDATREVSSQVAAVDGADRPAGDTLLGRIQASISADVPPPSDPPDLDASDRSIEWHLCHGTARQVEVLRDVLLHLLQERDDNGAPRFEPRDIAVLCPDVPSFAPFAHAAFAGDPANGVPSIPLRVADRSLRADNALLDAVGSLLHLVGGRLSATDVLSFASLPAVRRQFALSTERLERIGTWARATNVRWGLDVDHRSSYGLPSSVTAHTWRSALDQLLLGATMADVGPRLGPGGTVPFGDIEADDVATAGQLAELIDRLAQADTAVSTTARPGEWCDLLADAARHLFAVSDDDAHQWRDLDRVLTDVRTDAEAAGNDHVVAGRELAGLVLERLANRGGRPRFATGAVTLSSLTAQRGVPHRVVCLVGLDGDLTVGGVAQADDLTAVPACVGDRDPRSELRAQLLDAVLAAQERLVLVSTGRDVRTNAEVAPAVVLAELVDLIDASARPDPTRGHSRASAAVSVHHPRQAWNIRAVARDALRPGHWTFDRSVLAGVAVDGGGPSAASLLLAPEPDLVRVSMGDLLDVARNPVKALLRGRLGVWLDKEDEPPEDLIPVDVSGLDLWRVSEALLRARLDPTVAWSDDRRDSWVAVQKAVGAIPPLDLGRGALTMATERVEAIVELRDQALGRGALALTTTRSVDVAVTVDGVERRVLGELSEVGDSVVVAASASSLKTVAYLQAWITAAALAADTGGPARAVVIGRNDVKRSSAPPVAGIVVDVASADHGRRSLELWVDLWLRARRCVAPVLPDTSIAVAAGNHDAGHDAWTGRVIPGFAPNGDGRDPWVSFVASGLSYEDLLALPVLPGEVGDDWPAASSRVECWSRRIWEGLARLATTSRIPGEPS